MFIFKKFHKQNVEQQNNVQMQQSLARYGVQPMDQHLQKKFARGIQYNMKIIIRGDRNVGKSCLFYRLQGDKFHEEYVASEEIKVASIQWNYNATDDIVKVEIWDVVDKGKKRECLSNNTNPKDILKMRNSQSQVATSNQTEEASNDSSPALDAEFVDVYKGTNGVIFLFDMTKSWTFDYVTREIRKCPLHIPILILANHRDMGHHRVVTADQVQGFIDSLLQEDSECNRQRMGQIRYSESSMRNGFGLRYLYKFFNLPYLHLQRETMLKQLERNLNEIDATCQELNAMADSEEYDYDNFLEMLTNKRRMAADQLSAAKIKSDTAAAVPPRSTSMPANIAAMTNNVDPQKNQNESPQIVKPMPSIIIGANNPLPPKFQQQFQKKSSNVKSIISKMPNDLPKPSSSVKNIDDFVPDDSEQNMFRKFLDEPSLPQPTDLPNVIDEEDSEDDDMMHNNSLVAKYQEELDPEDMIDQNLSPSPLQDRVIEPLESVSSDTKDEIEINSEPEDNQDDKFTENSNVESEDNNQASQPIILPVLNPDDIDALENLYITKNSRQNGLENDQLSEASVEVPSTKKSNKKSSKSMQGTTNGVITKKKKKTNKSPNDEIVESEPITRKKKVSKIKTKSSALKSTSTTSFQDIEDEDHRQLEEFLGTRDIDDDRNPTSYQMF